MHRHTSLLLPSLPAIVFLCNMYHNYNKVIVYNSFISHLSPLEGYLAHCSMSRRVILNPGRTFRSLSTLFLVVLSLHWCTWAFFSCGEQGLLRVVVPGPLSLWGSRHTGSVVEVHGLRDSKACGIFPYQVSNLCCLHWYVDSYPLCHQGSPHWALLKCPGPTLECLIAFLWGTAQNSGLVQTSPAYSKLKPELMHLLGCKSGCSVRLASPGIVRDAEFQAHPRPTAGSESAS